MIHLVEFKETRYHQDHFTFLNEKEIEYHLTIHKALTSFGSINYKTIYKKRIKLHKMMHESWQTYPKIEKSQVVNKF